MPVESAGADRDADPAALEVQVLGRARIRQAFPSPASASVGGCFPRGEEAGQLLAGHVVQGDREVAVRGRCLRWFGVIVVSRAGVRGTGGGPGVLPARSGRAGRGRVWWRAGWSSSGLVRWSGRSASGWCSPRERRVRRLGCAGVRRRGDRAGPADGGRCLRGAAFAAGRPAPAGAGGPDGAGRGGRDAVARVPSWVGVLSCGGSSNRVCWTGLRVAVDVAGVVQLGGRGRRRGLDRGPGGVDGLASGAGWPACLPPRWER